MKIPSKGLGRVFMIDRVISLFILTGCVCGIVGLAMFPSEMIIVNVLAFAFMGSTALKQVKDLFKIHFAEKQFYEKIRQMMEQNQEEK